ncbi:MAG: DUF4199 domain-containing protein [Bacteroidetes bacterium]|nr:DUF4199 domain-containing protein [Bacteroidota bacterium]
MKYSKNIFWKDAFTTGLYVGLALSLSVVVSYVMRDSSMLSVVNNIIVLSSIFGITLYRGKLFSKTLAKYKQPFPFVTALKYSLTSICLSGVIYGAFMYIMYNHIAEDYYRETVVKMMEEIYKGNENSIMDIETAYDSFIHSPIYFIISSVFAMLFMGILPSLLISSIIKRNDFMEINNNSQDNNENKEI